MERGHDAAAIAVLGERRGRVPRDELRPVPLVRAQRQHAVQRQEVPQARARRRVGALDGPALRLAVELAPERRVPGRRFRSAVAAVERGFGLERLLEGLERLEVVGRRRVEERRRGAGARGRRARAGRRLQRGAPREGKRDACCPARHRL